jgi:glyceraldehyde 3-phosphate dehydrogenase
LKLIDKHKGVEYGDIVTIHPLLNHQRVLDSGCIGSVDRGIECNLEFGRSATQNIIPSKTTTIEACSFVMPTINSNSIASSSLRVPTSTVGAIAVTLFIKEESSKEEIISLCHEYEKNQKFDIMLNSYEALVSSDFQKQRYTTIVDHRFTDVKGKKMVKLLIWYDNEWGYASKVVDIIGTTSLP